MQRLGRTTEKKPEKLNKEKLSEERVHRSYRKTRYEYRVVGISISGNQKSFYKKAGVDNRSRIIQRYS